MKEFIDETSTVEGTPINRANMMAIQGWQNSSARNEIGGNSIIEIFGSEALTTTRNPDGSFTQTFQGSKTITKTITFNDDGTITEVIS